MVYVPHVNVVIVGAMASGKTTMLKEFINRGYNPVISCTTRPKRRGEKDGVDYHFVTDESFRCRTNIQHSRWRMALWHRIQEHTG